MLKKVILSGLILFGFSLSSVWSQSRYLIIEDFKEPLGEWFEAGNAKLNPGDDKKLHVIGGKGVLIREHGKKANPVNYIKLELYFMKSKKSR